MATQLILYNDALRQLGERKLTTISDAVEPRRVLDDAYEGAVKYVLEKGFWKFALREVKISYTVAVVPTFGYLRAYAKPSDFVRLHKIAYDEFLVQPIIDYREEALVGVPYWYGHSDDIYISYVSNGANYGGDLLQWPETFTKYVGLYLAVEIADRVAPTFDTTKLEMRMERALKDAIAKDAVQGAPIFFPSGTWVAARRGRY